MRPLALAWLLVTGCAAAPPGEPLTEWERADAPDPHAEAPEEPPEGLVWQPVESSADLVFDVVAPALWLRAHTGCREGWRDPVAFLPKTYVGVAAYWRGRRVGPRVSYRYASGTPWYAVPVDCEADTITFRLSETSTLADARTSTGTWTLEAMVDEALATHRLIGMVQPQFDENGEAIAIEIADYFDETDGRIDRWMFSGIPDVERAGLTPFSVPRFHRTLTSWVSMILGCGLTIEAVGEPMASPEVALAEPVVADTRIAPLFLHIRARKPRPKVIE